MIPMGKDTGEGTGLLPGASTNDQDSTRQRTETEEALQGTGGDPDRENSTFKDGELPKCMTLSGTFRQGCAGKCLTFGFLTREKKFLLWSVCQFLWCKYPHYGQVQAARVVPASDYATSSSHELAREPVPAGHTPGRLPLPPCRAHVGRGLDKGRDLAGQGFECHIQSLGFSVKWRMPRPR